jgi:hypothetical protein
VASDRKPGNGWARARQQQTEMGVQGVGRQVVDRPQMVRQRVSRPQVGGQEQNTRRPNAKGIKAAMDPIR